MIPSIIIAIILFGFLIFIHELGHFLTAKHAGVGISEFSIGMGPKIFSRIGKKDNIVYSLRLFPIGGYVSMLGEDEDSRDENALCNKPKFTRFLVLVSGALMNLLLGLILMIICVSSSSSLYSNKINRFLIADKNGAAVSEYMGLHENDEILKINNTTLNIRYDYLFAGMRQADKPCTLTVLRDGQKVEIHGFVFPTSSEKGLTVGNPSFFVPAEKEKTFFSVIKESVFQTGATVKMVWLSLFDIISGRYGAQAVSGPVGVVSEIKNTISYGIIPLLFFASLLTINIGVFNLLPFPALDGGRIFFLLIEAVLKKPVNRKIESAVNFAGLVLLMALMVFVTFNDILKLFTRG